MELHGSLESRIGYIHMGDDFVEYHISYWDSFVVLTVDDSREEDQTITRSDFENVAAAESAYKAQIEAKEADGCEVYYTEGSEDEAVEDNHPRWCDFKLLNENYDEAQGVYSLKYTFPSREELESWYNMTMTEAGYREILQGAERYYTSGEFTADFLAPEEFEEGDVTGTSFTTDDDPLEILSNSPSALPEKLIGKWTVTIEETMLDLRWTTPSWFPADDEWRMQDTQALFQRIDDGVQDQG